MDIATIISTASIVFVALVLGIKEWKSGSGKISNQVIANYEALDKQQKEIIAEKDKQILAFRDEMHALDKSFTERIAKLEGIVQEKNKQLENFTKILANRSPELENVLSDVKEFMRVLTESTLFQNKILKKQQERDEIIDESTEHGTGKPLRK